MQDIIGHRHLSMHRQANDCSDSFKIRMQFPTAEDSSQLRALSGFPLRLGIAADLPGAYLADGRRTLLHVLSCFVSGYSSLLAVDAQLPDASMLRRYVSTRPSKHVQKTGEGQGPHHEEGHVDEFVASFRLMFEA